MDFKIIILILILIVIFIKIINKNNQENFSNNKNILFTCTSFISKKGKFEQLNKFLDSFIKYNKSNFNLINEFLIINEYDEQVELTNNLINKLKKKYPNFTFINKKYNQKGQAKSLNIIIDHLKKNKDQYKYWLHCEESWECKKNFLNDSFTIMENSNISQLQFTPDWKDILNNKLIKVKKYNNHIELKANNELNKKWNNYNGPWKNIELWPFFSLRPGIDRVDEILNSGYFTQDITKFPVQFEFEFALNWVKKNNITKAIFKEPRCYRQKNHVSTYQL